MPLSPRTLRAKDTGIFTAYELSFHHCRRACSEEVSMRSLRNVLLVLGIAGAAALSTSAWSYGGHYHGGGRYHGGSRVHLGFVFGGPLWYPPLYPYPAAYPYPPAVVVPAPRVYVERDDAAIAQDSAPGYWYYCRDTNLYYPYAKECAGPWERVPARPQP
jgi:hypothetical protein